MKIKVYKNKVQATIDDDLVKFQKYFKERGLEITLDVQETSVEKQKMFSLFVEGNYDIVMYIYDRYIGGEAKSFAFDWSPKLKTISLSTSKADDSVDYTWINMAHELTHCLFYMLKDKGVILQDPMDINWSGNGPYYKNDKPFDPGSNHAEAMRRLSPHITMFNTYKYFSPAEVAKWKLKPELWTLLDKIRAEFGFPINITSGLRTQAQNDLLKDSVSDSAHLSGLACDIACTDSSKRFRLIKVALAHGVNRIGIAKTFIHLDIDKTKPSSVVWHYY